MARSLTAREVEKHDSTSGIDSVTPEGGRALIDRAARKYLDVSGETFIDRFDRGEYHNQLDDSRVARVAMLRPFAE